MSFADSLVQFGNPEFVPEGWFWLARSKDVRRGKAKAVRFLDREFVLYRGDDGVSRLLDAHCPHMGAHLCDGKVEGDEIRCPFHRWRFGPDGTCTDVPAQPSEASRVARLRSYRIAEKYGLVWLWTGEDAEADAEPIPAPPELAGRPVDFAHGAPFTKDCHPNVMMINAIDAHHFRSVHNLIVDLDMQPRAVSSRCLRFENRTPLPDVFWLRWAKRFYRERLTYDLCYWWGHVGTVTLGPDFLHFHIMFALRPTTDGKAEGQTILLTGKRRFGWLVNPLLLVLTRIVGGYFAVGDTQIFRKIRFRFATPIRADRPIVEFARHYERQKPGRVLGASRAPEGRAAAPAARARRTDESRVSDHAVSP